MGDVKKHSHRLSVERYEEFYGEPLHEDLVRQYHVPGFPGLLLSRQSTKIQGNSYVVCPYCKSAMTSKHIKSKKLQNILLQIVFSLEHSHPKFHIVHQPKSAK
jgi:hypothetical protein